MADSNRRQFLGVAVSGLAFALPPNIAAAQAPVDEVPQLENRADFAGVWQNVTSPSALSSYVAPLIKSEHVIALSGVQFSNADQILEFIRGKTGKHFVDWFNAGPALLPAWRGRKISGEDAKDNFSLFWDAYARERKPTMLECLTYMSVFINEVGGNLRSVSERGNPLTHPTHPGISYFFDTVEIPSATGLWRKASYNKGPNKTCLDLFQNNQFIKQFGNKKFANELASTTNSVWVGTAYPKSEYPCSTVENEVGIILECDFFKCRGRGLIQTTWRKNYEPLVDYVKRYSGSSERLKGFMADWKKRSVEEILTTTSTREWDSIFEDNGREVLTHAVLVHAKQGKYLPLANQVDGINAISAGSIAFFGDMLGGRGYGQRLRNRLAAMCDALLP